MHTASDLGVVGPTPTARVCQRPLGLRGVTIVDGFWAHWQQRNAEVTIPDGARQLREAGNFRDLGLAARAADGEDTGSEFASEFAGAPFIDSDIYKWMEAVAWAQSMDKSSQLTRWFDEAAAAVAAAQCDDGYLNSFVQAHRRTRFADLTFGHELYCAGHLIQAAVAAHRSTGDTVLLAVARRFADYLAATFGPGKRQGVPGHPEIETALVELFRDTGERSYLDLAAHFVEARGNDALHSGRPTYFSDRIPVREATTVEGHAVRALYLAAGAADVAAETGDVGLLSALERQWESMTAEKMYLTGGIGSRWDGEAFGDAYELPADRAYCETCAAIGSIHFSWRLLLATGKQRYADLIERTLYNAFLAGISLDGLRYFYVNPLRVRQGAQADEPRSAAAGRQHWFDCACCPPNIMRLLASLNCYLATTSETGIAIHQYASASITTDWATLGVRTDYPMDGRITVTVQSTGPEQWELAVRIPTWAEGATASLGGDSIAVAVGEYLRIGRSWEPGDELGLELPLTPRFTTANARVDDARGQVAIEAGALVYCVEQTDQPVNATVDDVSVRPASARTAGFDEILGVARLRVDGVVRDPSDLAYVIDQQPAQSHAVELVAIPYYAWANRELGPMRIWIPVER